MFTGLNHPDDLEVIADEMAEAFAHLDLQEDQEEHLMNVKLNEESERNIEAEEHVARYSPIPTKAQKQVIQFTEPMAKSQDEEVEQMMANVFDTSKEEDFKVVLFKEDGNYGYVSFSGMFDSLELVIGMLADSKKEITVTEAGPTDGVDFFLVDMATKPVDILYGVNLVARNAFLA